MVEMSTSTSIITRPPRGNNRITDLMSSLFHPHHPDHHHRRGHRHRRHGNTAMLVVMANVIAGTIVFARTLRMISVCENQQ